MALGSASASAAGTVVAIGGALRDDNHAIWSRLVALAGGPGARYVVLGTVRFEASNDARSGPRGIT